MDEGLAHVHPLWETQTESARHDALIYYSIALALNCRYKYVKTTMYVQMYNDGAR